MKRRIRITPAARSELLEAFNYLESQQQGLATRLSHLLRTALRNILAHPLRQPVISEGF